MKNTQLLLQSVFPLPQQLQQLIQAEAFLLLSPKPRSTSHKLTKPTFIRCIQYQTQQQAKQNLIRLNSLSNAFHLQIMSTKIKHLLTKNQWCLIIEMQQTLMSMKQKISMNKNRAKLITQDQLIMLINCMNILYKKYLRQQISSHSNYNNQKLSTNQLLDNIFVTQNELIKLSLPQLIYPSKQIQKKHHQNNNITQNNNCINIFNNKDIAKFSLFLINILTIKQQTILLKDINLLKQQITYLRLDKFCMKSFKSYLLAKINLISSCPNKNIKIQKKLSTITKPTISYQLNTQQQQNFPKVKFTKRPISTKSKLNNENNTSSSLLSQKNQYQNKNLEKPQQYHLQQQSTKYSHLLQVKFTTLNQLAHDKIVQSFQSDQYSYILQSNNTSPSRISPYKGSISRGLGFSNLSSQSKHKPKQNPSPSRNRLSPPSFIQSQSQVIPQQLSNSYDLHQQLSQFHYQQQQLSSTIPNKRSRSNSHTSYLQDTNSIILEVQQQSNHYDCIEGSTSFKSQMIDLSFSRGMEDDQEFLDHINQVNKFSADARDAAVLIKQIVDKQKGQKYCGQMRNGLKEGKGKMHYHDGGFYEGQWKNNLITGFGRLFYPSNKLAYAGYWHQGCFHGPGLVLNQTIQPITQQNPFDYTDLSNLGRTWISYRGNFNMDVRQGFGVVKLSNGDSISGVWNDNCLNGEAQYHRKDGTQIKGLWKMNKLIKIVSKTQNKEYL